MPVGVFGGKARYMDELSPIGSIYHAGTLSGNPVAMTAGIKTIELLSKNKFHTNLENKTKKLMDGISNAAKEYDIDLVTTYSGGMFGFFFTKMKEIKNFTDVQSCNGKIFEKFFKIMLAKGIYFAPSMYEAGFISSKHSSEDINYTIDSARDAFLQISKLKL